MSRVVVCIIAVCIAASLAPPALALEVQSIQRMKEFLSIPQLTFKDPETGHELNQLTSQYVGLPKDHTCACVNMAAPAGAAGGEHPAALETSLLELHERINKVRRKENVGINGDGKFVFLELKEGSKGDADASEDTNAIVNIRPSMPFDKDNNEMMLNGNSPSPGQKSMFCYCSKKHPQFKFDASRYKQKCSKCCFDIAWKKERNKSAVAGNTKPTRLGYEDMKWQCKRRCKKLCRRACIKKAKKYNGGTLNDQEYTTWRSKCMATCDQAFTALVQNDPTGKNYHFLRPFTSRIFDRRYGLKYYRGERDSSIWNDRMRFVRYFLGEEKNGSFESLAHKVQDELSAQEKARAKPPPDPMEEHKLLTREGGHRHGVADKYWKTNDKESPDDAYSSGE